MYVIYMHYRKKFSARQKADESDTLPPVVAQDGGDGGGDGSGVTDGQLTVPSGSSANASDRQHSPQATQSTGQSSTAASGQAIPEDVDFTHFREPLLDDQRNGHQKNIKDISAFFNNCLVCVEIVHDFLNYTVHLCIPEIQLHNTLCMRHHAAGNVEHITVYTNQS